MAAAEPVRPSQPSVWAALMSRLSPVRKVEHSSQSELVSATCTTPFRSLSSLRADASRAGLWAEAADLLGERCSKVFGVQCCAQLSEGCFHAWRDVIVV